MRLRFEIAVLRGEDVRNERLRIPVDEREPAALHLNHDAVALLESVILRVEVDDELLDLVRLNKARDRLLGTYSKGMLQRIGLAQALIYDPRLVVLDEPTAGVDPAGSREIRDLIMDLKRRGITVLLSSHLLAQAQEICDRIGILADGVLVREGPLQELIAIENQTELVIADASDELMHEIESFIGKSNAKLLERRKSTTTLERLFLESTGGNDKSSTRE